MPPLDPTHLHRLVPQYCQQPNTPIGRAVSTERAPNTTSHFHFWSSSTERRLQLGNIVAAVGPDDISFGVIVEMSSVTDAQSFLADYFSHDFGRAEVEPPSEITEILIIKCAFLTNVSTDARPVGRARIYFPTIDGLRRALSLEDEGVPVGVFRNGDGTALPVLLNQNYIIGPEGAHVNISGISGLASKTSFALFLIKSIMESNRPEREQASHFLHGV